MAKDVSIPDNNEVATQLASQGAIHGLLGRIYERLGGEEGLHDFIIDEGQHKWFYTTLFKATPTLMPMQGVQGDVNIIIHNELPETDLDGATIDEQGRVVDG